MFITKLSLLDFRNLHAAEIKFDPGMNIFYGDNAQGKTNILESIYLCATGRSHRTRTDSQLVYFEQKEAHIRLFTQKEKRTDRIDVHIKREEKKGIAINGIPIRKSGELFGTLYVVIFSPEDLQLIKNSPGERRRFLDLELCQLSQIYYYHLQQYYKILKQRNHLLKRMQRNQKLKETLFVWDEQLIQYGMKMIESRKIFIGEISSIASRKHQLITGDKEKLELFYRPNTETEEFKEKLASHLERDILIGSTSVGPHKDDIVFFINGKDVKTYGSQGQQRTTALSVKLAEIDLVEKQTGQMPVVLLDDVLSELDEGRQRFLLNNMDQAQIILTCTGLEDSIKQFFSKGNLFLVEEGQISHISEKKEEEN